MHHNSRLAILDWGIGGISVLQEIKAQLGNVPVIYFSDTGATPYGKMSRTELVSRLQHVIAYLQTQGATHLVIGCNAASTAIPFLQISTLPIEGVIDSAVQMTAKMKPTRLALIGGRRTVLSGVYRRAFAERGINVAQRIAQPLSGLIESGDTSSIKLRDECRRILAPIKHSSYLLLACTHYPAITNVLREFMQPNAVFINPAGALVKAINHWQLPTKGKDLFLTTGAAEPMKIAAKRAFNCRIENVVQVRI